MKHFIATIFTVLLIATTAAGQGRRTVPLGTGRTTDTNWVQAPVRFDSLVQMIKYATSDTNKVLGVTANGMLVLRSKGSGGSTDLSNYFTKSQTNDTIRSIVNAELTPLDSDVVTLAADYYTEKSRGLVDTEQLNAAISGITPPTPNIDQVLTAGSAATQSLTTVSGGGDGNHYWYSSDGRRIATVGESGDKPQIAVGQDLDNKLNRASIIDSNRFYGQTYTFRNLDPTKTGSLNLFIPNLSGYSFNGVKNVYWKTKGTVEELAYRSDIYDSLVAHGITGTVGGGGVTSVAVAVPSGFSVSGSPITTSGTITISAPGNSATQYINGAGGASLVSGLPVSTAQAAADATVQAYAIQRSNHTGTQTASTISDFTTAAQATVTGAASTVVTSDLADNRVVISNGIGKIAWANATSTEVSYLEGVTSAIQPQLDGKQPAGSYLTVGNSLSDVGSASLARDNIGASNASNLTAGLVPAARIDGTATNGRWVKLVAGTPTWTDLFGTANTWTADQSVPDEAYDATAWNGSMEMPTKNAVRDKIESLGGSIASTSSVLKGNGAGSAVAATAGTDYVTPSGAHGTPSSITLTNATGLPLSGLAQSTATSGQVATWNGSAWAPATPSVGGSSWTQVSKSADQSTTNTSASPVTVTDLQFAVTSGTNYIVKGYLLVEGTAGGTGGFYLSSAVLDNNSANGISGILWSQNSGNTSMISSSSPMTITHPATGFGPRLYHFVLYIKPYSSGTFAMTFYTTTGGNTTTIKAKSFLEYQQL